MSDNALISPKSVNRKHNNIDNIEFLDNFNAPDLRFEEFFLKNKNNHRKYNKLESNRIK